MKKILLLLSCVLPLSLLAQEGSIKGQVIDNENAEEMIGVSVLVEGASAGAITDLDGKFEIKIKPGVYTLRISYISYQTLAVENVKVVAGDVNVLDVLRMISNSEVVEGVVVRATAVRNTETALMTVKRKSPNLIDGISSASFKKIGDSDAASAMKRVTGVSVEGGKYVYVRGLGDRYTKTTLNGMDIPGLDPDRNTLQMDIFPTNIISNITVSKSFSAEQSADFTGGAVNIDLIDFADKRSMTAGVGIGYNPAMHFNNNYTTYTGGQTDAFGFDDGTRTIPTGRSQNVPQYANVLGNPSGERGKQYTTILNDFNKEMGVDRAMSLMNYDLNFAFSDAKKVDDDYTIGYNLAITYKNETDFYEDAEFNLFGKDAQPSKVNLIPLERQKGDFGVNNVLIGGLAGLSLKTENSKYRLNILHLQNGEKKAGLFDFVNTNLGANFEADQYNLEYSQKELTNILFDGSHRLRNNIRLDWKVSPTRSAITDPDIRFLRFRQPTNNISTEAGLPERIWRFLEEYNLSTKVDLAKDYRLLGRDSKIKFGGSYTFKMRDYEIQSFQIQPGNTVFTGNPDELFAEENLFSAANRNGVRYDPSFIPTNPNKFNSSLHHFGSYVSTELKIVDALKTVVGVRVEKYDQFYTGTNQTGSLSLDNDRVISDLDLFPSLNLIYALSEMQNLRFSFSQTIARPSFKEMSFAEILDPITGRTFIGSLLEETTNGGTEILWDGNLQSSKIANLDLRWELFQDKGRMISLGAFYKRFNNPIEMVQFLADPGSFQARNVGDATVLGSEFELRQNFKFISHKLEELTFSTNVTYTYSSIELSESEFRSRTLSARDGETVERTRKMAGQAPFILNSGLSYNVEKWNAEGGIFYNVQGETLLFVGFANRTDVYSVPFHNLGLKFSKSFGEKISLSVKASNLLNDEREQIFKNFEAQNEIFTRLRPQRSFSLSFGYRF